MDNNRINILTPVPFWHPGTMELIEGLNRHGIRVVALDIWSYHFFNDAHKVKSLTPSFLNGLFLRLYKKLFRKHIIRKYIDKDDIVDIQWCGHYYAPYMQLIKKRSKKLHATLFGSDLYRTDEKHLKQQKVIFDAADKIVMGVNMQDEFEQRFPGYSELIHFTQYGSKRIDLVNELNNEENKTAFRKSLKLPLNKIILTFGYNSKKEQQHSLFFETIKQLPADQKGLIHIVLPMTYGVDKDSDYFRWLLREAEELDISATCLTNRLSDRELAMFRVVSDITVNTQTTDALSSSVKEAIVAGDLLIVGDWLPYDLYEEMGIYFIRSNRNNLASILSEKIKNLQIEKKRCMNNAEIIVNFASWKRIIPEFMDLYYN